MSKAFHSLVDNHHVPEWGQGSPPLLGLSALTKLIKKTICAKFPGQLPFGILREDSAVTAVAEMVAHDRKPCLGVCKATYITLWLVTYPMCQLKPPFGR